MSGLAVGFGIDSNCLQAHFLSGIDDTAGDLSTVGDQQAPDIYGFAHYRSFSLSASCSALETKNREVCSLYRALSCCGQ